MKSSLIAALAIALSVLTAPAQSKRPLELEDLFRIKRVSDPALSPDGKWIAFTIEAPDKEANKNRSDLWIISSDGGTPRQLTRDSTNEKHAAWSHAKYRKELPSVIGLNSGDDESVSNPRLELVHHVHSRSLG